MEYISAQCSKIGYSSAQCITIANAPKWYRDGGVHNDGGPLQMWVSQRVY